MDASPIGNTFRNKGKVFLVVFTLLIKYAVCDTYYMEDYCGKELSFITTFLDQLKLELNDDGIYDGRSYLYKTGHSCSTTIEAWYTTYPKLMFYFEDLDLDCDKGHLEFYSGKSGSRRVKGLENDICGNSKPEDVYAVDDRYFRIKYVPKRNQYVTNMFSMIITAFADDSCPSYAYKCHNSRCIDKVIRCNGYNSCGDESGCNLEVGAIVGIAIGSVVGLAIIISIIITCYCCFRKSKMTPRTVQPYFQNTFPVAYTASSPPGYGQVTYGVNQTNFAGNQGSPYPTNQAPPYPGVSTGQPTAFPSQNYSSPASFQSAYSNKGT